MNLSEETFSMVNMQDHWLTPRSSESIRITADGITLAASHSTPCEDTVIPGAIVPLSLAVDGCGALYVLDEIEKDVYIDDRIIASSRWLNSSFTSLETPRSIAVSGTDIYVVDHRQTNGAPHWYIACLSAWNGQVLWQRETVKDARITAAGGMNLYVLDVVTKGISCIETGGRWLPEGHEIHPTGYNGAPYPLVAPIDIAADPDGIIYILEADNSILCFNPDGEYIETLDIPFDDGTQFLNLAVAGREKMYIGYEKRYEKQSAGSFNDDLSARLSLVQLKRTAWFQSEISSF